MMTSMAANIQDSLRTVADSYFALAPIFNFVNYSTHLYYATSQKDAAPHATQII